MPQAKTKRQAQITGQNSFFPISPSIQSKDDIKWSMMVGVIRINNLINMYINVPSNGYMEIQSLS